MQYPRAAGGRRRHRLDAPLRAARGPAEELEAWRDYLREPRRRLHRRARPRRVPLDLHARPRRPRRRDRHPRARLRRRRAARLAEPLADAGNRSRSSATAGAKRSAARVPVGCAASCAALALRHRADRLGLRHPHRPEKPAAACAPPPMLAHQQVRDRHALRLPRAVEHNLGRVTSPSSHLALELGARQAYPVGLLERPHVLWRRCCGGCVHRTSPLLPPSLGGRRRCHLSRSERARTDAGDLGRAPDQRPDGRSLCPVLLPGVPLPERLRRALDRGPQASPEPPLGATLNHPPHSQRA